VLSSPTVGPGTVALAWSTPADGGSPITGYTVYRSSTAGVLGSGTAVGKVTSWTDTTGAAGSTYYYTVSATNAVGEGAKSEQRSATLPTVPAAPVIVATAGNAFVSLSWSAPANGGSAIQGYNVFRSTTPGGEAFLAGIGTGATWNDTSVVNGTTYYYKVSARNAVGEGPTSNEAFATPAAPADTTAPSKPTGVNKLSGGTNQMAIGWNASTDNVGVAGYEVYRNNVLVGTVTTRYFLDSGLNASTSYTYRVLAFDAAGNNSVMSNTQSVTTSSQTTSTKGTIGGVVFDADGNGIDNATATFTPSSGSTKSDGTNNKGAWSISNLNGGVGSLTVSAPGHGSKTVAATVVTGKTTLVWVTLT
jgi:hypothetical protein